MNMPLQTRDRPHPMPQIVNVTPKMAEEWLKTMVANRPLSEAKWYEYATAMVEGRWSLNGESIKFKDNGELFDGQHRLQACIAAGVPFRTYVIRGIDDPNAFATVDTGKARSAADVFGIAGWQNNKIASGAALIVYAIDNKRLGWGGITGKYTKANATLAAKMKRGVQMSPVSREELHTFAKGIEQELAQAVRFANSSKAARVMPSASVAALYLLFRRKAPNAADEFFSDLGEGVGLQKTDAVYTLREKLMRAKAGNAKLTRFVILGFTIKAWNARRDDSALSILRVSDGEHFPKIK